MDFGNVLSRAWKIIWKFKVLWIFGILAGFGQALNSGGGNSGYRFSSHDYNFAPQLQQFFNRLSPSLITLIIAIGIILALALTVIVILVGTVGRVGLIRGTVKAEQGAERLTFGELWREGLSYFWRVFGLNLLIGIIIVLAWIALFIVGIILAIGTLGLALLCLIPLLCLLIPLMWVVSIIIEQANVALVVENLSIGEAIKRGWQVFIDHIGTMIVMGLILIVGISWIGGAIIGLPLLAIAAPAAIGIATGINENITNGIILSAVLFLVYLPFLLVFSGILRSYISSAWTLTYLRLTTTPTQPVIVAPEAAVPPETPVVPEAPVPPQTPGDMELPST